VRIFFPASAPIRTPVAVGVSFGPTSPSTKLKPASTSWTSQSRTRILSESVRTSQPETDPASDQNLAARDRSRERPEVRGRDVLKPHIAGTREGVGPNRGASVPLERRVRVRLLVLATERGALKTQVFEVFRFGVAHPDPDGPVDLEADNPLVYVEHGVPIAEVIRRGRHQRRENPLGLDPRNDLRRDVEATNIQEGRKLLVVRSLRDERLRVGKGVAATALRPA